MTPADLESTILDWPCEAQFQLATRIAANVGYVLAPEPLIDRPAPAAEVTGLETIQTLLDLLNPLHGSLDKQTYDDKVRAGFDAPSDAEYAVNVTAQQERDLTQAVMILENRKRQATTVAAAEVTVAEIQRLRAALGNIVRTEVLTTVEQIKDYAKEIIATPSPDAGRVPEEELNRIKYKIDAILNDHLCEMKPLFDDSIVGFNEAWDIVRKVFADAASPAHDEVKS